MPKYWDCRQLFGLDNGYRCKGVTVRGVGCANPINQTDCVVAAWIAEELCEEDIVTFGIGDRAKRWVRQLAERTICLKHRGSQTQAVADRWSLVMREFITAKRRELRQRQLAAPILEPAPEGRQILPAIPVRRAAAVPAQARFLEERDLPTPNLRPRAQQGPRFPSPIQRLILPARSRHLVQERPVVEQAPARSRAANGRFRRLSDPPAPAVAPILARHLQHQVVLGNHVMLPLVNPELLVPRRPEIAIPLAQPRRVAIHPRPDPVPVISVRKPLDEGCYVCYEDFDSPESAFWCRRCGQNLHVDCFLTWNRRKRPEDVTCAYW